MKIEEFLEMNFREKTHTFESVQLKELQKEIRNNRHNFWTQVDKTKLKDCREDKAAILNDLRKLLEKWYEAPIIIKDISDYQLNEGDIEEEEEYK